MTAPLREAVSADNTELLLTWRLIARDLSGNAGFFNQSWGSGCAETGNSKSILADVKAA